MKILYVVGAYGRRYIANEIHRELLLEWSRRGHQCVVYAGVTPRELHDDPLSYVDDSIVVQRQFLDTRGKHRLHAEVGRRIFHYPRFLPLLQGLRQLLRQHPDIDVIHADAIYPIGAIVALATLDRRIPIVPSIHGGDVINYPGYGYGRFPVARRLLRWTFKRSACVRVNSQLMAAHARSLGCPPEKIRHILVNIGNRFFEEQEPLIHRRRVSRLEICRQHGFDIHDPLLLSTGRLLPLKGFHDLIEAMALLQHSCPPAKLILAGSNFHDPSLGDQRQALRRAIAARGLEQRVVLRDELDYEHEMMRYLQAADVVSAPAHIEGLNRVVAEAGTQGTPSVVSSMAGIAPLVAQAEAGLVVDPGNPGAIAAGFHQLLESPERYASSAANARRLAQRFRSAVVADALLDLYHDAVRVPAI